MKLDEQGRLLDRKGNDYFSPENECWQGEGDPLALLVQPEATKE